MSEKKPTRQAEIVFAAMKAIEANGGEMRISDIYETPRIIVPADRL